MAQYYCSKEILIDFILAVTPTWVMRKSNVSFLSRLSSLGFFKSVLFCHVMPVKKFKLNI